jgi:hypothetical protein
MENRAHFLELDVFHRRLCQHLEERRIRYLTWWFRERGWVAYVKVVTWATPTAASSIADLMTGGIRFVDDENSDACDQYQ